MTRQDLLLGIDIGTQGVKGALVNARGTVVVEHFVEHGCSYPNPGWVEHDMLRNWWHNPVAIIRRMLGEEGIHPAQVKAICASGLHPNLGPTDEDGNPLRGAILYSDNRAIEELREINQHQGLKLTSEELTPKLVWFLRHETDAAARMRKVFDAAHYLVYRLTREYISDTISAGGWGAIYNSPTASWREDICQEYGIQVELLPKVYPPITVVGVVNKSAAEATGLERGTPVLAGTNDVSASSISAGAVRTTEAIAYYGTAGLLPVMKEDMIEAIRRPFPGIEKGLKPQEGYLFDYPAYCLTTGDSLRWFRDEFGQLEYQVEQTEGGPSAYARYDLLAAQVPPGSDGLVFLPYLLGQRSPDFNPDASGMFFGLKRLHTRGHIFRALLEAWGYSIRHGLESFYPHGHPLQRLIATGGGARSQLWRQIVSDITAIPQQYVPNAEGTLADAYLAGMALGWFHDFDVLINEWIEVKEVTQPNSINHASYNQAYYPRYVKLHQFESLIR